jgi:hypothetical protein
MCPAPRPHRIAYPGADKPSVQAINSSLLIAYYSTHTVLATWCRYFLCGSVVEGVNGEYSALSSTAGEREHEREYEREYERV